MKKPITRFVCCLLLVLLFVGTLTVSAAEDMEWNFRADGMTLTDGTRVYHYYHLAHNVVCSPRYLSMLSEEYYDLDEIDVSPGYLYSTELGGGNIVWAGYNTTRYINGIYVLPFEMQQLNRWQSGNGSVYRMRDKNGQYATFPASTVIELNQLKAAVQSTDVRTLEKAGRYDIYAFDDTNTWGYPYGAIYVLSDGYYYLNYTKLGNEHFDADGNFSYRRGNVFLSRMSNEQATLIDEISEELEYISYEEIDKDDTQSEEPQAMSLAAFWIVYFFLGIILPIPLIFIGIFLARSHKLGYPKYWYVLSAIAGFWLLLGMVLAVLLALM